MPCIRPCLCVLTCVLIRVLICVLVCGLVRVLIIPDAAGRASAMERALSSARAGAHLVGRAATNRHFEAQEDRCCSGVGCAHVRARVRVKRRVWSTRQETPDFLSLPLSLSVS